MRVKSFALAAGGVAAAALLTGAAPQSSSSPLAFLEGDEHFFPFTNQCGRVFEVRSGDVAALERAFGQDSWNGECRSGLAHGVGLVHNPAVYIEAGDRLETRTRYVYGHTSPYVEERINVRDGMIYASDRRYFGTDSQRTFRAMPFDGRRRSLSLPALGEATPAAPLIWDNMLPPNSNKVTRLLATYSDANGVWFYELSSVCDAADVATFPEAEQRRARSVCRGLSVPTAYSIVTISKPTGATALAYQRRLCTKAPRGNGCAAVWTELTGHHHADWAEIQQQARRAHSEWEANLERRYAAAIAARSERDRQTQAQAQDDQTAFIQGLETASAGELFSSADEMFEAGRPDRARAALRALIRRFPDSPLAARAADQLASLSTPGADAAAPQASRSAPATSGTAPAGGCSVSAANAVAAFNGDFRSLRTQRPLNSNWGTRDTYQYSYFLGVEGLKRLEPYRACMAPADFQANKAALEGMRDQGLRGCEQTSSGSGTCVPEYPG